jgi:phosphoserine phosphatase
MSEKGKILSLSAIGLDSPGLVSKITNSIFQMNGNILDVEENCRKGLFSIFLIVDFSASSRTLEDITATLNNLSGETGLKVIVGIYDESELSYLTDKESHVVTILGEDKPGIIAKVSDFFHQHHINIESCRMIARGKFFSMEMGIDTSQMHVQPDLSREEAIETMKGELKAVCEELNQSVVIQSEDIYQKRKKLIVFDVESTLIQEGSLKEFLEKVGGKAGLVQGRTEFKAADEDKMQTLIENARVFEGMPIRDFEKFGGILELNTGALELIGILKSMGFKIALLTSGFNFFVKRIFEEAGVDYAFSNALKSDEKGIITGELEEPIITSDTKQEILDFIMNVEKIRPEQVIAVGDGSTGSHFIENVGLSIAFKPQKKSIKTDGVLSTDRLWNMLYCLGIPKRELEKHLKGGPS